MAKPTEQELRIQKLQSANDGLTRKLALLESTPNPFDLRSILAAANVSGERFTLTVTKTGTVESIVPVVAKPDVVVDCKEKHKRCIATYRIKRIGEEHERLVCDLCVGSGNQNSIMVRL